MLTAKPIEMHFGVCAHVGLRNYALGGGPVPPQEGAFGGHIWTFPDLLAVDILNISP